MTWEETIKYIRTKPEYAELVEKAYLEERLELNIERFMASEEWLETLRLLKHHAPIAKKLLDVGSGNGISAIAFAKSGYQVTVVEPDTSETIGAGAIRILKDYYRLDNIKIIEAFAENAGLQDSSFDIVYCRQSMHHANNLNEFVENITTYLKTGGIFLSARDHVIYNQKDKNWFLQTHPLQQFYGGENAFKASQYRKALHKAKLDIIKEYKYFENTINYFPTTKEIIEKAQKTRWELIQQASKKIPFASSTLLMPIFKFVYQIKYGVLFDERLIAGRLYSYLAKKR